MALLEETDIQTSNFIRFKLKEQSYFHKKRIEDIE
jgi:hypothetical protein